MKICGLCVIASIQLCSLARAGGIGDIAFPPLPLSSHPITVDGKLTEWSGIEAKTFRPFAVEPTSESNEAVTELQKKNLSVAVRLCYDVDALYVALDWQGLTGSANTTPPGQAHRWSQGGDGVELHLLTDQMVHVACWPAGASSRVETMARVGEGKWREEEGLKSSLQAVRKDCAQEIRLPWALLTKTGKLPAYGKVELLLDFVWKDLTPDFMKKLPVGLLRQNTHVTVNFLTVQAKLFSRGYLPNPQDWGDLTFTDSARPSAIDQSPMATGATAMFVERTPQPPDIDARLDDWKGVDFQSIALAPGFVGDRYTGRIATRFDGDNLYLAAHFTTPTPMQNLMREATQQGFSGGDCLQLRLKRDNTVRNICAWYDTLGSRPALTSDGAELKNPFLLQQGAKEAFLADGDGRGYAMELSVPWQSIFPGKPAPKADETWKATCQPWWAGLNREFSLHTQVTLEKRGALLVNYTMPEDGEVSLGIFDLGGKLLRWITRADYRYKGANTEYWDGLDQWGNPLPAGSCTVKAVYHPPLTTEYVTSLDNPGNPPWPTADGKGDWLSDESTPQAVATDGKWVFLAAPGSEKGWSIIAVDEQGQRQWGLNEEFYPRCVSLSLKGAYLYALFSGPELTDASRRYSGKNAVGRAILICVDKRTGKPVKFTKERPHLKVTTWPYREEVVGLWELRTQRSFAPGNYAGQPRYSCYDLGESDNALGIAAVGDRLCISLFYEDRLLVLDANTAEKADEIPLPKPVGLYPLNDTTVLAVSGTSVVKVDLASKQVTPLVATGLVAPHSVTTDRQGNLYVSDWGASFQVKVFSPQGRFLRAIGKEGGRLWIGPWAKDGMLVPRGIAVTDDGKVWVAEDDSAPKRVSVWDARTGAFVKDYLGPAPYGGGGAFWIDPKDPTVVFSMGAKFRADLAKKTYTPLATTGRRMSKDQPFALNGHGIFGNSVRVLQHDGSEYVLANGYHTVVVFLRKADQFVPVAAVGGISRLVTDDGTGMTFWDSDLGYHLYRGYFPDFFRGHAGDNFSWSDLNMDGLVQPDEMRWVKTLTRGDNYADGRQPAWMTFWGAGIAPDWSIFYGGFCRDRDVSYRMDLNGWSPNGAPLYDIQDVHRIRLSDQPISVAGYYVNAENKLFISYRYEGDESKKLPNVLSCHDRDGILLWEVAQPKQLLAKDVHQENVIGDFNVPKIGNVLGTWLWHGNWRPYLLTSDGLYVSTLLDDTLLGPTSLWGESYKYYFQTPDGTPYIVNGANDSHHILKIGGLQKSGRFTFPLQLTEDQVQAAAAMRAIPAEKKAPKPILNVTWLSATPKIDGSLDDWMLNAGASLDGGGGRTAEVALGRDAENLYLAYRANDTTPLLNKGADWQKLFTTGDCVDLMLATDSKADPNRRASAKGDLRLLLSTYQDQPIAVLYRPVVPGTKNPVQLMAARVDDITQLPSAKVQCQRGDSFYTLEAALPLKDLGIDPEDTGTLKGDVGVIYSDETGRGRSLRLYYYNKETSVVSDLTTEATLLPNEWGAVQFPLGSNLLENGGFEEPFAAKPEGGWFVEIQKNGGATRLVDESPRSGKQSLLIEQTTPVTFPDEFYTTAKWEDAYKFSGNSGHVSLCQRVPVTAGKQYEFRMSYRTEDMCREVRRPGKDRGYAALGVWIFWVRPRELGPANTLAANEQGNEDDWETIRNTQTNNAGVTTPYTAPEGATAAIISFKFTTCVAGRTPKVWVDDVELVERGPR